MSSSDQRFCENRVTARKQFLIQLQFAIHVTIHYMDARGGKAKHPSDIFWSYKMPRRAHDVSTKNRPFVKHFFYLLVCRILHTSTDRPFCSQIVLCLNRT